MHATFFSMQLGISLVYMLSALLFERGFLTRSFYFVCSIILSAGLIQLCSKSVFIALIIVINFALPYFMLQGAKRWRFVLISSSFSVLVIFSILSDHTFKERYITELRQDLTISTDHRTTTNDTRLQRWGAAIDLIGGAPVIGHGAGSEISLLQEGFFNKKLYSSYLHRLNTHSQYLSLLIKSGIVGLLVYIATLAYGFKICFEQKDLLFFTFLMLTAIVSLSENLLDVDKGICFYAFFFSFFIFSNEGFKTRVETTSLP